MFMGSTLLLGYSRRLGGLLCACGFALLLLPLRLAAQGQLDGTWPDVDIISGIQADGLNYISSVAAQPDGKVLIAGPFSVCHGQTRMGIARLNGDGTLDTTFDPGVSVGPSGRIHDVIVRPDGKILIAGEFSFFGGANANSIALLNADGSLNSEFNTAGAMYEIPADNIYQAGLINDMALDPQGRILIAGRFNKVQGVSTKYVAKLEANGQVVAGFAAPSGYWSTAPHVVAAGADSRVLVGGYFTQVNGEPHDRLVRFEYDGTIDQTFNPGGTGVDQGVPTNISELFGSQVKSIVTRPDGGIYIAGVFSSYNGSPRSNIARLNSDGSLNNAFSAGSGPNGPVFQLAIQDDGKVLVAGYYSQVHDFPLSSLVRMTEEGGLDLGFTGSSILYQYPRITLQADGKILVCLNHGRRVRRFCPEASATWYADTDGDGHGDPSSSLTSCGHPVGYVSDNTDNCPTTAGLIGEACNDGNAATINDVVSASCVCAGLGPVSVFPWEEHFTNDIGGFTKVDGSQINKWVHGSAIGHGAPSIYVSNTGTTNNYSTISTSTSHIFRDIAFPATASALTLSLSWTGMGQASTDRLRVWLVPTSFMPQAGSIIATNSGGQGASLNLSGDLSGSFAWQSVTYTIPASYIGQSARLVLEWSNDASGGTQAPAAVDNIEVCASTVWYADGDGDGYGDPATSLTTCGDQPPGYVLDRTDICLSLPGTLNSPCDDGDPNSVNDVLDLACACVGTTLPWNEDFTDGPGGFTFANGNQINKWYWGSVGFGGIGTSGNPVPGLYASNNGGANLSSTSVPYFNVPVICHAYHDIPMIPADASVIKLAFDSKLYGWGADDDLSVWLVPQSYTPVAGTAITATGYGPTGRVPLNVHLDGNHYFHTTTLTLPSSYAGQSARIIFQWLAGGSNQAHSVPTPPVVDNIHLCCLTPTSGDADSDGVLDCLDPCPNLYGLLNGQVCDDGNAATYNDVVTNCVCAGVAPVLTPGHVVLLQVGDGTGLGSTGAPITLRDFSTIGVAGNSVVVPSSGTGTLVLSGSSTTEGGMSLNADGTKLVFGGYVLAQPSATVVGGSLASSIPRAIATVDAGGIYTREVTSSTAFDVGNIRGAAANGLNFWATGSNQGVNYLGTSNPSTVAAGKVNLRAAAVFNGQLYISSASASGSPANTGIFMVGSGMPVTGGQALTTVVNTGNTNTNGFYIKPTLDVLYVAIGNGGIQKWVKTGAWALAYTLTFSDGALNLVADFAGASPELYVVSNTGSKLLKITDPGTGSGSVPVIPVLLATAATNTAWRGISFAPTSCPLATWYEDADADGFGDHASFATQCGSQPVGYVSDHTDDCTLVPGKVGSPCDDGNAATINDVLSATCTCVGTLPTLTARVLLQGPYDAGTSLMSDALRSLGTFPLTEPYSALGLAPTAGDTSISPSVLSVTGNDAIVDWVLIELRSPASPVTVVMRRCALLQRDGTVVDLDGLSPVSLPGITGPHHVAVRHRNHLGVMTLGPVTIGGAAGVLDFADDATLVWGTNARFPLGAAQLLYMGDCTGNGAIKYTGSGNDRDPILVRVGSTTPNNTVSGYFPEDVNLNGQVKYTGSGNDRDPILINVGSTTPTNTRNAQLP